MTETIEAIDFSKYIIPVVTFLGGWIAKIVYERYTLNYKLKVEYTFEQKKKLKEEIAKNKIHLLNSMEELNHRLWNFSQNVDKNWHNVSEIEWQEGDKYYIQSFVYRFLKVLYWTIKTEKDAISIDTTIVDKEDILFLKYVKTFKDIFTDADLLKGLNYDNEFDTNHFFKNNLNGYANKIVEGEKVIDFDSFIAKTKNEYSSLKKIIEYISKIENKKTDKNLNILRCFHLISIQFLNKYGHDYQKTKEEKIKKITSLYKSELSVKNEFTEFIEKSKLTNEMKKYQKKIK